MWATFRGITNEARILRNEEERNENSLITGSVHIFPLAREWKKR
jgi:hypothetical protein